MKATMIRSRCLNCGREGKYLGVFRDRSGRIEIKRRIWHCEKCGAEAKEVHHVNQVLCKVCHMAVTLDAKAKKLSEELAKETDPGKIYIQLMAWVVEVAKYREASIARGKPNGPA